MSEIIKPEDSIHAKNWGTAQEEEGIIYMASTTIDSKTIGKLPAHQWILPEIDDWDHADGLLTVQELFEGVPPAEWGQKDALKISSKTSFH